MLLGLFLDLRDAGRGGLLVGEEPADANLFQAVALGQVAEGGVRGDDRLDPAVRQARPVFAVKGGQVVGGALRVRLVGALVVGVDLR